MTLYKPSGENVTEKEWWAFFSLHVTLLCGGLCQWCWNDIALKWTLFDTLLMRFYILYNYFEWGIMLLSIWMKNLFYFILCLKLMSLTTLHVCCLVCSIHHCSSVRFWTTVFMHPAHMQSSVRGAATVSNLKDADRPLFYMWFIVCDCTTQSRQASRSINQPMWGCSKSTGNIFTLYTLTTCVIFLLDLE